MGDGASLLNALRMPDACWNDIEAQCKDVPIGQCVMDKAGSVSSACQKVVSGIRQPLHGLAPLKGMPAFSADGKNLGEVVEVVRGPDGSSHPGWPVSRDR
jgi:hypothetical protein